MYPSLNRVSRDLQEVGNLLDSQPMPPRPPLVCLERVPLVLLTSRVHCHLTDTDPQELYPHASQTKQPDSPRIGEWQNGHARP